MFFFLIFLNIFLFASQCYPSDLQAIFIENEIVGFADSKGGLWKPNSAGGFVDVNQPKASKEIRAMEEAALAVCCHIEDDPDIDAPFNSCDIRGRSYSGQMAKFDRGIGAHKNALSPASVIPVVGVSEDYFLEANIDMAKFLKTISSDEENWLFVTCWCVGDRPGHVSVLQEAAGRVGIDLIVADCGFHHTDGSEAYIERKRLCSGQKDKVNIVFWANSADDDACFGRFFHQLFCGDVQLAKSAGQLVDTVRNEDISVYYAFTFTRTCKDSLGVNVVLNDEALRMNLVRDLVGMDHYGIPEAERFQQWKFAVQHRLSKVYLGEYLGEGCVSFPNDIANVLVHKPSIRSLACKLQDINPEGCQLSLADLLKMRPFKDTDVLLCAPGVHRAQGFDQCVQCELLFHALVDLDRQGVGCVFFDGESVNDRYKPDYELQRTPKSIDRVASMVEVACRPAQKPEPFCTELDLKKHGPIPAQTAIPFQTTPLRVTPLEEGEEEMEEEIGKRLIVPNALLDKDNALILPALAIYAAKNYSEVVGFDPASCVWFKGNILLPSLESRERVQFFLRADLVHARISRMSCLGEFVEKNTRVCEVQGVVGVKRTLEQDFSEDPTLKKAREDLSKEQKEQEMVNSLASCDINDGEGEPMMVKSDPGSGNVREGKEG